MKTLEIYPTREAARARFEFPPPEVKLKVSPMEWHWENGDTTKIVHVTSLEDARHLAGYYFDKVVIHETVSKMGYDAYLMMLERRL